MHFMGGSVQISWYVILSWVGRRNYLVGYHLWMVDNTGTYWRSVSIPWCDSFHQHFGLGHTAQY